MTRTVTRQQIADCVRCRELLTPELVGACASVGIEHGKSTPTMMFEYLATQHFRDHHGTR